MSKYIIDGTTLRDIADAIRAKKETTDSILVGNFASEIADIETGGGVIDVEALPKGRYYDIECYFKYGAASESNMTLEALFLDNNYTPAITYYGVEALPETPEVTNMQTANPCHIYIYNNIAYMYGDLGSGNTWATVADVLTAVSGTTITNKGFTSDITAATEVGVYVTYKEDEDPVDGSVYRITTVKETPPEMWLIADGDKATFSDIAAAEGATLHFYVVDVLPETMEAATQTMFPIYILSDTGVGYISQDGTSASAATLGTLLFGAEGFDKGYTDDVESIDATVESNMGAYCVRGERTVSYSLHYYVDGKWYGGGAGDIVDVEELPVEYKDVDIYIRLDDSTYMTFLQLFQSEGITPDLHYYVVDELPTVGKASDFNSLSVVHCYIANNIPYVYGDLGNGNTWVTVSAMMTEMAGMSMSDKGFTSDITTETEAGIYVTYKEGEKPVEGAVYRLTTETESALWIISDGQKMDYGKMMEAEGATLVWHMVEVLPDTMEPVNMESMTLHLYVLNGTGIGYLSEDGTSALTFGQMLFGQEGLDKGWATDIDSIDATLAENMGIYIVPAETFITYNVYSDGVWTDYIEGEPVRTKIDTLTAENEMLMAENETLEPLRTENETLKSTNATLTTENEALTSENATLAIENETLMNANETLTAENETLAAENVEKTPSANFTDYAILSVSDGSISVDGVSNKTITAIKIHKNVKSIGQYAFQSCYNLTSVNIPDNVTSIGKVAFAGCQNLVSVNIPKGITNINERVFEGCAKLSSIDIPDSVTSIGDSAFENCRRLTSNIIPTSVLNIGNSAFRFCNGITSVDIHDGVTSLGRYAFYSCDNLESVNIPKSVINIGNGVFGCCRNLTSVMVDSDNANYISVGNVLYDREMTEIFATPAGINDDFIIPESVTCIGGGVFAKRDLITTINIPEGVTDISYEAFSECNNLTNVNIPDSVIAIGIRAFYRCNKLTAINIPKNVNIIKSQMFEGCSGLTSIHIPEGVTEIETSAFKNCTRLTSIVIPSTVMVINGEVFMGCSSMQYYDFTSHTVVPTLRLNAFKYIPSTCEIRVPTALYDEWVAAANWSTYADNIVAV